jgi:NADPH-dependent glutamate synthase beta subunit-like oxidoreductase
MISDHIGISLETARYNFADLPDIRDEPLFERNYNLCINCTRCIRVCKDVRGVGALGFVWQDDKAVVGTVGPTLKDSGCKFCGACVEVCPTGTLTDLKPVGADREANVRCTYTCPAGVDVPRYIRLIAEGKLGEALAVVKEKVPLPSVLGYVCAHPCEEECKRGELNDPIAICNLKRFAADQGIEHGKKEPDAASSTGKKVAIVGSGPAGLTAAYYIAKLGHAVTIFEALSEPGGMMRVGIPEYRLPREILQRDIDELLKIGIEIKLNTPVGNGLGLDALKQQGYDALFLATGAHLTRSLNIEGVDSNGVFQGVYFLRDSAQGKLAADFFKGQKVVVVGGGNVAIDAARTALRLGAESLQLACLESRDEMPAHEWEIQYALDEGAELNCCWGPKRIIAGNGKVSGVEFIQCTAVFDEHGRFNPLYNESVDLSLDADAVIIAIGQAPDTSYLGKDSGINLTSGNIKESMIPS